MPWFYQQILSMVESYSTALSRGVVSVILLWPLCVADADIIFMAAPSNRAGHYIFALWFFLSFFFFFFSSSNLSRPRLDVYHTSTHGVALVRI